MALSKCSGCSHWHWCSTDQFPGDKSGFHYCDKFSTNYQRTYLCGGKYNDHKVTVRIKKKK